MGFATCLLFRSAIDTELQIIVDYHQDELSDTGGGREEKLISESINSMFKYHAVYT
jgi:hypothetical protein